MSQKNETQQQYANMAAKLGDLTYRQKNLQIEIQQITQQIDKLLIEEQKKSEQSNNTSATGS